MRAEADTETFQGNPMMASSNLKTVLAPAIPVAQVEYPPPSVKAEFAQHPPGLANPLRDIPARPALAKRGSEKALEDRMGGFIPLFKRPEMTKPDPLTGVSIQDRINEFQKTIVREGWNGGAVEGLLQVIDEIVVIVKDYKEKAGKEAELARLEETFNHRMASSKKYYGGAATDMQQEGGWEDGKPPPPPFLLSPLLFRSSLNA
jgi:hypothetical protein